MSMVAEHAPPSAEGLPAGQYINYVRNVSDPSEQLEIILCRGLYRHPGPKPHAGEEDTAFLGLAADTSRSLTVSARLTALENVVAPGLRRSQYNQGASEAVRSAQDEAPVSPQAAAYRYLASAIAEYEPIDRTIWFKPWTDADIDRGGKDTDYNPAYAFAYLDRIEQELAAPQPSAAARCLAPLIRDVHQILAAHNGMPAIPDHVRLQDWYGISNCLKLVQYGDNYRRTLLGILEQTSGVESEYVRTIGSMTLDAPLLARSFPAAFHEGVMDGYRHVLADAMYAVLEHVSNEEITNTSLELGTARLPLHLEGGEPLNLLKALQTAVRGIADNGWSIIRSANVKVAQNPNFTLLRLADWRTGKLKGVSVYIRPEGAATYDEQLEYGRPGEGVEASIGYVVDVGHDPDKLMEVGKHRRDGDDKRISIRLDREGRPIHLAHGTTRRDPTIEDGTLSLDVGSILGRDDWLSTKVGRFLAWGNVLRTTAADQEAQFNHVTKYFTAEYGNARFFAAAARMLIEQFAECQLDTDSLQHLLQQRRKTE